MKVKTFLFLVLFSIFSLVVYGSEIDVLIANAPSRQDYPDASIIYLMDRTQVEIDKYGNYETYKYLVVKILNDRGRELNSDIERRYNKGFQKFEILKTVTHLPDGKTYDPTPDGISDVSAPEVMWAPQYSNMMIKAVSFPHIIDNCVIEYEYKITSKKKLKKKRPFDGSVLFQKDEPILNKEFIIIVPDDSYFRYDIVNSDIEPEIERVDTKIIYKWKVEEVPQIKREPNMIYFSMFAPRLIYTNTETWEELGTYINEQFKDIYKLPASIKKKINEKVKDCTSEQAKIKKIYEFVVKEYRNVHIAMKLAGFKPTKIKKIYYNRYGDRKDRIILYFQLQNILNL
jgi:hypothetical protein